MTTKAKTNDTVAAVKAMADEGMAQAQKGFEQAQAVAQENMGKAMKAAEEFATMGQGNIEAFVKAGQIWATGMQDLSKQMVASTQHAVDETVANAKALAGVKSVKEAMDIHARFVKVSMEKAVTEGQKFSEAVFRLAEQAAAPITARVQYVAEHFAKAA